MNFANTELASEVVNRLPCDTLLEPRSNAQCLQRRICAEHGVNLVPAPPAFKLGVSRDVLDGASPIHGLRHPPEGDTTGWYVGAGEEISEAQDYFQALHVQHLNTRCPQIRKFLGLPPGWRFLIAGDYEDVWFDESSLIVE